MAKAVTRRTLLGFRNGKTNMWAPDDLINKIKNQPELFIKKVHDLIGRNVKIKAIVGNPPYQEVDGGAGVSAKPMYHYFVDMSKKLSPSFISLVMPARWFAGGKGLDEFRNQMLTDDQLRVIHDFIIPQECFPSVQIKGGICYFLWCNGNPGDCEVVTHYNGVITSKETRPLLEDGLETFIRFNEAIDVIAKVKAKGEPSMKPLVSSRKPFGFDTTFKGQPNYSRENNVLVYQNKGIGYVNKNLVTKNTQMIAEYKIFIPRASSGSDNFPHPILGEPFLGKPQSICSETYMYIGPFASDLQAQNAIKYIRTKFLRFLALQLKSTQDTPAFLYTLVPLQDFTANSDIDWSQSVAEIDRQLYQKYHLNDKEIAFIESMIKPM
jgi:site-specific DNA-methyltransferase (adenine-specific)